ncbi:2,3-diketo-5-methylthio-1-phosphopentane phosphatase [Aureobasidium pullulans]|uniref:Enolase-phosphatase E1 n=1 Tax=Aureobasidium pullulans TaxID=5580 RepID=A0A4S9EVI8_AURPU|nr:2,3-diketo-5-methylthio-1-phosphopentane phosphatase [Aureobasidium pullulans]
MLPQHENVGTVLLDIEGTVCPISFVKDTLFPYALKALSSVIQERWDSADFKPYRDAFPTEAQASPEAFEAHVKDLTARDVKIAYLKNLQGYLWQAGYENGAYSTPLFDDVAPQLQHWHDSSKQLVIYSSGSIFAQKLLFGHVQNPLGGADEKRTQNLQGLIDGWFDTTNAGLKHDASSYTKIAEELGKPADTVLFLSDNVKEVKAAIEAGMQSIVVDRPGNAPLSEEDKSKYQVVETLNEISLSPAQIDHRFFKR